MKKKLIAGLIFSFLSTGAASANDAWIKVDANGNAIGGAIVCSADVCGDSKSVYSQHTLQPGERYVLQFKGDPVTGNVAGIPATNPDVKLKVDLQTNQWTKTTTQNLEQPTPILLNDNISIVTGVQSQETWNPLITGQEIPQPVTVSEESKRDSWWYGIWSDFDWSSWDAWLKTFWAWYELQDWTVITP